MHTQCQGADWPTRSPGIARRRRGPGSGTARPSRPAPIEAVLHNLDLRLAIVTVLAAVNGVLGLHLTRLGLHTRSSATPDFLAIATSER